MYQVVKKPFMVSASVSCMDQCCLKEEILKVEQSHVSFFHYDVVDGHFNRCIILGETTLEHMRPATKLPIEVHLAVEHPEWYIDRYAKLGADYIAVHYETMKNPLQIFESIRKNGAIPVLAYKSTTPPDEYFASLAKEVPWILKLTVNPGYSGQTIQPAAIDHIRQMKNILETKKITTKIQADGNINSNTIQDVVSAGATILTGGTSGLFLNNCTIAENTNHMLNLAQQAGKKNLA